jgi:hypothetical protein
MSMVQGISWRIPQPRTEDRQPRCGALQCRSLARVASLRWIIVGVGFTHTKHTYGQNSP